MCSLGRAGSSPAPGTLQQHPYNTMKQNVIFALFLLTFHCIPVGLVAQSYTSYMTGNPDDAIVNIQPAFILAGGGTDNDDAMKWMLSRAKGGDVVVLRASGSDGYNTYLYEDLGVNIHSVETILFHSRAASSDPYVLDRIKNAEVIFIAGGDQTRYFDYWSGTETGELLKKICKERSKVVGGTSAGMMILGNLFYAPVGSGVTSAEALGNPYHPNLVNIRYNTLMETPLFTNTIFDSHFDNRSRGGRLLVFLAKAAFERNIRARAIACNESTAVCIDENNIAIVFGNSPEYAEYAYFLEVNCEVDWKPKTLAEGVKVQWTTNNGNTVIAQKLKGTKTGSTKFDLNTWEALDASENEYWQVKNGVVQKTLASNITCSLIPSSVGESADKAILIFPNPTDSIVYFPEAELAELLSVDGIKLIAHKNINQIDVSSYKSGEYILKLIINGSTNSFILTKM